MYCVHIAACCKPLRGGSEPSGQVRSRSLLLHAVPAFYSLVICPA